MRKKLFSLFVFLSTRHPRLTLAAALLCTLAMGYAASLLEIRMTWTSMLPQSEPVVKEFNRITERFEEAINTIVVAVEGGSREQLRATAQEIERAVEPLVDDYHFRRVTWKAPVDFIR